MNYYQLLQLAVYITAAMLFINHTQNCSIYNSIYTLKFSKRS